MERITPFVGLLVFIAIGYSLSSRRKNVPWAIIVKALFLQFAFAALVINTSFGRAIFDYIGYGVSWLTKFADEGALFVFGSLAGGKMEIVNAGNAETYANPGFILAFRAMPILIFYSALSALLFHLGILTRIVKAMAFIMEKILKVSGAEALTTAANVFLGQSEAPILVKPYLQKMTRSEMMTVMVGGMATIAGSVFAVYVAFLEKRIPNIAGHLLAASVISAPASIMMAKLFEPETENPETGGKTKIQAPESEDVNMFAALSRGTIDGTKMSIIIIGTLIAFVALMAMFNGMWGAAIHSIGSTTGYNLSAIDSLSKVLGNIFSPFAFLMGIELSDCRAAGHLLAERMCLNEFIAYTDLANHINNKSLLDGSAPRALSDRTVIILSYALCGFANFGSIGILIGGIGEIAPTQKKNLAVLGLRSMIAATLATAVTACIAAILI